MYNYYPLVQGHKYGQHGDRETARRWIEVFGQSVRCILRTGGYFEKIRIDCLWKNDPLVKGLQNSHIAILVFILSLKVFNEITRWNMLSRNFGWFKFWNSFFNNDSVGYYYQFVRQIENLVALNETILNHPESKIIYTIVYEIAYMITKKRGNRAIWGRNWRIISEMGI